MLTVITGPPCSGKTTWAMANAGRADVVIDLDRMAVAMAGTDADPQRHDPVVYRIAQRARWAAIQEALRYVDKADVYIVHTQPTAQARARYEQAGARIITLDPGRDVTLDRCKRERGPEALRVAEAWYAEHAGTGQGQVSRAW